MLEAYVLNLVGPQYFALTSLMIGTVAMAIMIVILLALAGFACWVGSKVLP